MSLIDGVTIVKYGVMVKNGENGHFDKGVLVRMKEALLGYKKPSRALTLVWR